MCNLVRSFWHPRVHAHIAYGIGNIVEDIRILVRLASLSSYIGNSCITKCAHRFADVGTAMVILSSEPSSSANCGSSIHLYLQHFIALHIGCHCWLHFSVAGYFSLSIIVLVPTSCSLAYHCSEAFLIRLNSLTFCITNLPV